jgi:hypothetical protein
VVNNKYIARIRTNAGGNTHLGCFDSQQEAAAAYDVAAIALRGPHAAITNFPTTQYLTPDGMLRPELLDLLSRASTPIVPIAAVMHGSARRRPPPPARGASAGRGVGGGSDASRSGSEEPPPPPPPPPSGTEWHHGARTTLPVTLS